MANDLAFNMEMRGSNSHIYKLYMNKLDKLSILA
jgi:hypothetical protein